MQKIKLKYKKENRSFSNIELIRVVSMLCIMLAHFTNVDDFIKIDHSSNSIILLVLYYIGKTGVPIFSIISGFYMSKYKLNLMKLFKLEQSIWLYAGFGFLLSFCFTRKTTMYSICQVIFPVIMETYWFATAFFIMSLFAPLLVKLYKKVSNKSLLIILIISIIVYTILKEYCFDIFKSHLHILPNQLPNDLVVTYIFYLFQFSIYRTIGYLISEYFETLKKHKHLIYKLLIGYGILYIFVIPITFGKLSNNFLTVVSFSEHAYPTSLFFSVLLFLFLLFSDFKLEFIKTLAPLMFSTYLVSMNPWTRNFVFNTILQREFFYTHLNPVLYLLVSLLEALALFAASAFIVNIQKKLLPRI